MKRKPTAPSHVDLVRQADSECPALSWRERVAIRRVTFGRGKQPAERIGFDPLEVRLGLQADLRQRRPYYAIWSPIYHEALRNRPALDASLPGAEWLRTVYHGNRRDAVTLPGVRAVLQARAKAVADQYRTPAAPAAAQPDLFTEAA